jgi:parallel beta-helix repeat protein
MKRMMVCLVALFLLISVLAVPLKVHGDYNNNITIESDGSIAPSGAPMSTVDNITYVLTENMHGCISIDRDNVVLDGSLHTIEPWTTLGYIEGIVGSGINNVTIMNCNASDFHADHQWGMQFLSCSNMTFKGNNLTDNLSGIFLLFCSHNVIADNYVSGNTQGFSLLNATGNMITGNHIENNTMGIALGNSTENKIYHNNFLNNTQTVTTEKSYPNFLDNGVEGNYWSDYIGTDNNQDGIGDTPYIIDENNTDHYPLMGTFYSFYTHQSELETISNSTIGDVALLFVITLFPGPLWYIHLSGVAGQEGTTGFCRITFPNILMNSSSYPTWEGNPPNSSQISSRILMSNGTHTTLYFKYIHPVIDSRIDVLPEFPSFLILPLFFIATLLTMIVYRKRMARS